VAVSPSACSSTILALWCQYEQPQTVDGVNDAYQARFKSILVPPAFDSVQSDAWFRDFLRCIGRPRITGRHAPIKAQPFSTSSGTR